MTPCALPTAATVADFKYLVVDGEIVPYGDAKLHISTPAVRYGAAAFEGIRAYWSPDAGQLYLFRALDHVERLLQSAWLTGMEGVTYSADDLLAIVKEVAAVSSVDRFEIRGGVPGPTTSAVGATYSATASGMNGLHPEWMEPVHA